MPWAAAKKTKVKAKAGAVVRQVSRRVSRRPASEMSEAPAKPAKRRMSAFKVEGLAERTPEQRPEGEAREELGDAGEVVAEDRARDQASGPAPQRPQLGRLLTAKALPLPQTDEVGPLEC